jgi:bacterioferritin-associated ferredoxin
MDAPEVPGIRGFYAIDNHSHCHYISPMYVCVCNAITDRDLTGLAREGVGCAKEAYRRLGGAPVCGRCLDFAQTVIDGAGERPDHGGAMHAQAVTP